MAEYNRKQRKKHAAFAHMQDLKQNVKRGRGEVLVHVWSKVKRAFVRAQYKIIEFIFKFSVSFL